MVKLARLLNEHILGQGQRAVKIQNQQHGDTAKEEIKTEEQWYGNIVARDRRDY
jgi:hypothetical protein